MADRPHHWTIFLSIAAVLVSLTSAAVSIYTASFSKKLAEANLAHNRMTVRPLLRTHWVLLPEDASAGLYLSNRGVGPAVVRSAWLYFDGTRVGEMQDDVWDRLTSMANFDDAVTWWSLENGSVIQTTQVIKLFGTTKPGKKALLEGFLKKRLGVEVCYCSLYDDCWRFVLSEGAGTTDQNACGLPKLARLETRPEK